MSRPSIHEFQRGLVQLLAKAHADVAFNARCRRDPVQALREVAGLELPDGCRFRCLDVDNDDLVITLPPWNPVSVGKELADRELEAVQGGIDGAEVDVGIDFGRQFGEWAPGELESLNGFAPMKTAAESGLSSGTKWAIGVGTTVTAAAGAVIGWFEHPKW